MIDLLLADSTAGNFKAIILLIQNVTKSKKINPGFDFLRIKVGAIQLLLSILELQLH